MPPRIKTSQEAWASLSRRVGLKSKLAGLGFALLTAVFLLLSYYTQYIVFEIDSIASFLAAIVLLFSEPRRKVSSRLIDAILASNSRVTSELAGKMSDRFEYVPESAGVSGVALVPSNHSEGQPVAGLPITPPGRALAQLYLREAGVDSPTFDSLEASLPQVVTESFGLANTLKVTRRGDSVSVALGSPSFDCPCRDAGLEGKPGVFGCTVGSFFAVLVCAAEGRPLELCGCRRGGTSDTLELEMKLQGGKP